MFMQEKPSEEKMYQREFYPPIEPYETGFLPVDDIHTLYWEQSGNPKGRPVVFLHGGPGGGTNADMRRFFDPSYYRIILFDQRGSGKSTPLGELQNNTTGHLIHDIEHLRQMFDIDSWVVFGGSWGSTLALAYAIHHPARVEALILRGIFLCRKSELDFFYQHGYHMRPEAWHRLVSILTPQERQNVQKSYYKRLTSSDLKVRHEAAVYWSRYEGECATLLVSPELVANFSTEDLSYAIARMETHYFEHDIFLPENFILENLIKIQHIPGAIVQGQYDLVCPPTTAYELHQQWPRARYTVIPDAGHSATEPGIRAQLVEEMERLKG